MLFAEIKLSLSTGTSELRLDGVKTAQPPRTRLLSVTCDDTDGTVLVLVGRVFYKNDLKRRWAIELEDDISTSSDWALAAYRAGSKTALDNLV